MWPTSVVVNTSHCGPPPRKSSTTRWNATWEVVLIELTDMPG